MEKTDCLALTGSEPLPLFVLAVVFLVAGAVAVRWGHRRRTPAALLIVAALGIGGMAALGSTATPAVAAEACTTPPGTTPMPMPTATATPTPTPTPTDTPTPPAEAADFAIAIDPFTLAPRNPDGPAVDFTEVVPVTLTNITDNAPSGPVVVTVPAEADGYWTLTAVLNADGTMPAENVTLDTSDPAATTVTFLVPPGANAAEQFQFQLTYHAATWDSAWHVEADGSEQRLARPTSAITLQLTDPTADGHSASAPLPGYVDAIPAP